MKRPRDSHLKYHLQPQVSTCLRFLFLRKTALRCLLPRRQPEVHVKLESVNHAQLWPRCSPPSDDTNRRLLLWWLTNVVTRRHCVLTHKPRPAALTMSASRPQGTSAPRTRAARPPFSPCSWMTPWAARRSSTGRCRTQSPTLSLATSSQASSTRWATSERQLWTNLRGSTKCENCFLKKNAFY